MSVISLIKKAFQDKGYTVETRLQESAATNTQIIIIVDDIEYEVETDTSYFCFITLKLIFAETDPEKLIQKVLTFPNIIEKAIIKNVKNPIIESPSIDNNGHLYQVEIYCKYTEVLNIE